jgi:hypothetical protein
MKKRIILLCLVLCLLLPAMAQAAALQPDHAASLTLRVTDEGAGLAGVRFEVFRVAAVDENARFTLLEGYHAGNVDINRVEGAAAWASLAETLAAQVTAPTAAAVTDPSGEAVFANVKTGLYLAVGYPIEIVDTAYDFAPFLVSVPGKQGDTWVYAAQADVKHTETGLLRDVRIIKYWQDGNRTAYRPEQITVGLYCDGVLHSTAVLNAANGWMQTYQGLAAAHTWTVQELEVPANYTVSYTVSDDALIVVNTLQANPLDPSNPDNIPQTGLLWWPVPVLAVLGLVLILTGCLLRRKVNADE